MSRRVRLTRTVVALVTAIVLGSWAWSACSSSSADVPTVGGSATTSTKQPSHTTSAAASTPSVYAAAGLGALSAVARTAKPMVYVPNTISNTVQLIDPNTYQVVGRFHTGAEPQHVVPSWDLSTLWVNADHANTLTPIDPRTGQAGTPIPVDDPYNLYFTPDGQHALVMAERLRRIDIRDAHTMQLQRSLHVPCSGINHADFTRDLKTLVASCEFDGQLIITDAGAHSLRGVINLNSIKTPGATTPQEAMNMAGSPKAGLQPGASAMPQDVRLTPDGRYFLAADMLRNGIWVVDATTLKYVRFIHTGMGAHGIYPSRDAKRLFISNRDEGTISVLDSSTLTQVAKWTIPGGGSPDMGGVTADGKQLWLSGRYDNMVYVFDTTTGALLHKIPVDAGPHGLSVWPQPGRFSLGHTGNMR